MTKYGVTEQGFVIKRLPTILEEREKEMRGIFGDGINLEPTELMGQQLAIEAEREAKIWELAEDTYYSQYPDTAYGVSLDHAMSLTAVKRLQKTKSIVTGTAAGVLGTVIPKWSVVSVEGTPSARFLTLADATIAAGTNEVQKVAFSDVPDAGQWSLRFMGEETATLAYGADAADVGAALNNLVALSGVTVTGDFTAGFSVTFAGADGSKPQQPITAGTNTLATIGVAVAISTSVTTAGALPHVDVAMEAEVAGAVPAYAGTLKVIESSVTGWESFTNAEDATIGKEIETDAEAKLRRNETLATAGAGTPEAIQARLREIDEVTTARVFRNVTNVTDAFGRLQHSIEAIVQGGDEQEIADVLWEVHGGGIYMNGSVSKTVVDSQGFSQTVRFSRPTPKLIYLKLTLTKDANVYPVGGDEAVKAAVVAYAAANFGIGDEVATTRLFAAIHTVAGILHADIDIGTTDEPSGDANIPVEDDEVSDFDTSRITIA